MPAFLDFRFTKSQRFWKSVVKWLLQAWIYATIQKEFSGFQDFNAQTNYMKVRTCKKRPGSFYPGLRIRILLVFRINKLKLPAIPPDAQK